MKVIWVDLAVAALVEVEKPTTAAQQSKTHAMKMGHERLRRLRACLLELARVNSEFFMTITLSFQASWSVPQRLQNLLSVDALSVDAARGTQDRR